MSLGNMCDYNISADSCADRCCMTHDLCCDEGHGLLATSHCNRAMIECLQACSCEPNPGNCLLDQIVPVPATAIVGAMGLAEDWCCALPCPGQPAFDSSSYGHLSTAVAEVLSKNACPEASSSYRTDRFDGFMLGLAFWILLFGVGGQLFYVWHRSLLAAMRSARQELDTVEVKLWYRKRGGNEFRMPITERLLSRLSQYMRGLIFFVLLTEASLVKAEPQRPVRQTVAASVWRWATFLTHCPRLTHLYLSNTPAQCTAGAHDGVQLHVLPHAASGLKFRARATCLLSVTTALWAGRLLTTLCSTKPKAVILLP